MFSIPLPFSPTGRLQTSGSPGRPWPWQFPAASTTTTRRTCITSDRSPDAPDPVPALVPGPAPGLAPGPASTELGAGSAAATPDLHARGEAVTYETGRPLVAQQGPLTQTGLAALKPEVPPTTTRCPLLVQWAAPAWTWRSLALKPELPPLKRDQGPNLDRWPLQTTWTSYCRSV